MEKAGIIGRIKVLMSEGADNANSFSKKVGIDPSGFRKKMKGESPVMPRDIKLICDTLGVNREWLETGEGEKRTYSVGYDKNVINMAIDKAFTQCVHGEDAKPFYDVDFALGFSEICTTTLLIHQRSTYQYPVMRRLISGVEHQVTA